MLADIEWTPHLLDKQRVDKAYTENKEELDALEVRLQQITGGINLASPKQLGEFLYSTLGFAELTNKGQPDRTDSGNPKTDKATLLNLKATNKKQRDFLELYQRYNKVSETQSRYLNAFKVVCDQHDGLLFGELQQCRTVTHRLSGGSVVVVGNDGTEYRVQPQNIQRELKGLFTSPEGWLVGETDGSQLEFRVGAELGNDEVARNDIRTKEDVHANTARAFIAAKDPSFLSITDFKEARTKAKAQTFRPLFGGRGSNRFERAYSEFFKDRYSSIAATQQNWCYEVLRAQDKALVQPYGMVYYYPQARMKADGYIEQTTQIYNFSIN